MIWITFGWSSGWGQVKSGQTRSKFSLFFQTKLVSIWLNFDGEFNGGIFVFVDGLELPKFSIKNFVIHSFRGSFGNAVTKNWQIDSKFGMDIGNTDLYSIYFGFLKILKTFWFLIVFFSKKLFFWKFWSKTQNFENPR